MHTDARNLPDNSIIEGDICIIGAGTAGISMALDLMDTPHRVVLLEGGGLEYDDQVQDLNAGKTTGQPYYPLRSTRLRYFGGTTGHWAGMCSPFDPIDFTQRDWVPNSGWPITRADLDPFYEKAHQPLQLGPYNYDLSYWQDELPNMKPFPLDDQVVWNKMWQYSLARFNELHKDTILQAKNIHLYTYANVVDIRANEPVTNIEEVVVRNHAGKTHRVRARHFVLACGAIQNARLLLASNTQAPKGLGNDHDLVGRHFMEHIEITCAELWQLRPFPTNLYTWEFGVTKASAELAITEAVQTRERILNGTVSLSPLSVARHQKPKIQTWQDDDPRKALEHVLSDWAQAAEKAAEENKGTIARAHSMMIRIEQAPNPESRVSLDTEKDAFGVPHAHLHWQLTDLDKRSINTILRLIGHQIGAADLGRVKLEPFLWDENDHSWPEGTTAGWHHMGTTRMSDDARTGVVDANCRVHGLANLYVAGSACFSTSGAPNPTLTLVTLALRLSEHLKGEMG